MGKEELNGFDEFWSVYPRKVGKIDAMKAYKGALRLTTADDILYAADKYAHERLGEDKQYTKLPAGWLRAGRWGDYAATPATVSNAMPGFYASFSSPELEAWNAYERTIRKTSPRDKRGGWTFPTQWPPNNNEQVV